MTAAAADFNRFLANVSSDGFPVKIRICLY